MGMSVISRLAQRWRDHRQRMADRSALLGRLKKDGDQDALWQEIFAPPKPTSPVRQGHRGRCGCCDGRVDMTATICPSCGADWIPPAARADSTSLYVFTGVSIAVAVMLGLLLRFCFTTLINHDSARIPDFVDFIGSYLWVSTIILVLVLATYIYEKSGLAPQGHWCAKR